jgi:polyribonucleotide nucleotidyltransferase
MDIIAEPEIGKVYNGKVVKIVEFGAFVNFLGAKDGLLHVSQISQERVANVSDVLSEGQEVQVKVLDVDRSGKVKLSMKEV